jgi:hypothetical protein
MRVQCDKLLFDGRWEVGLETALPHDFSCDGLKILAGGMAVGHGSATKMNLLAPRYLIPRPKT